MMTSISSIHDSSFNSTMSTSSSSIDTSTSTMASSSVANSPSSLSASSTPPLTFIDRVILELIETERSYVKDLREIIDGYLKYMTTTINVHVNVMTMSSSRSNRSLKSIPTTPPATFVHHHTNLLNNNNLDANKPLKLTPEIITALFGNIESVFEFSRRFLSQLERCSYNEGSNSSDESCNEYSNRRFDVTSIARVFVENSNEFDVYTEYCTVHDPITLKLLQQLMSQSETSIVFKERQLSLGHLLPLGAYLLKPIQRILKYPLLLQNIVKHLESEPENSFSIIKRAFDLMTKYATYINDMKRRHEHQVRVQEIQSLLIVWTGSDLSTYGELITEQSFRCLNGLHNKSIRHLVLLEKMLLIVKPTKIKSSSASEATLNHNSGSHNNGGQHYIYKADISCSNLMLIESIADQHPFAFHVVPFDRPKSQFSFVAKSLDEKRKWCRWLKQAILDNYEATIPLSAKQALLELGTNLTSDAKSASLPNGHLMTRRLSAPEYLEKRNHRHQLPTRSDSSVRSSSSGHKALDMIHASLNKGFRIRKSFRRMYSAPVASSTATDHKESSEPRTSPEKEVVKMRKSSSKLTGNDHKPSSVIDEIDDEGFLSISNRNSLISIGDGPDILNLCPPPQTFISKSVSMLPDDDLSDDVFKNVSTPRTVHRPSSCFLSRKTSNVSGTTVDSGVGSVIGSVSDSSCATNRNFVETPSTLSSASSSLSMASSSVSSSDNDSYVGHHHIHQYSNSSSVRRTRSFNVTDSGHHHHHRSLTIRHSNVNRFKSTSFRRTSSSKRLNCPNSPSKAAINAAMAVVKDDQQHMIDTTPIKSVRQLVQQFAAMSSIGQSSGQQSNQRQSFVSSATIKLMDNNPSKSQSWLAKQEDDDDVLIVEDNNNCQNVSSSSSSSSSPSSSYASISTLISDQKRIRKGSSLPRCFFSSPSPSATTTNNSNSSKNKLLQSHIIRDEEEDGDVNNNSDDEDDDDDIYHDIIDDYCDGDDFRMIDEEEEDDGDRDDRK